MPLIKLENIWFRYPGGKDYVLKNINLSFNKGRTYLITGPNGAGKSTLLMIIAGLLTPSKGRVLFREKPLVKQLPEARRYIGILFQNPEHMLFNPTVYDEIAYVLRQLFRDEAFIRKKVCESLKLLGMDKRLLNRPIHSLSYGEQKLVAIASIISYDPEILLLDEPFTNLSWNFVKRINTIIDMYRGMNKTIIIVSHKHELRYRDVDEIIVLSRGKIIKHYRK